MAKKQTDNVIHDAEFTESPAAETKETDTEELKDAEDASNSLTVADPLTPLSPTQAEENGFSVSTKSLLITFTVIALLLLAALYLRGLQLAAV